MRLGLVETTPWGTLETGVIDPDRSFLTLTGSRLQGFRADLKTAD